MLSKSSFNNSSCPSLTFHPSSQNCGDDDKEHQEQNQSNIPLSDYPLSDWQSTLVSSHLNDIEHHVSLHRNKTREQLNARHFTEFDIQIAFAGFQSEDRSFSPKSVDGEQSQTSRKSQRPIHNNYNSAFPNFNCFALLRWIQQSIYKSLPCITTINSYQWKFLTPDLIAGLAVGVASVPMGKHRQRVLITTAVLLDYRTSDSFMNPFFDIRDVIFIASRTRTCLRTFL